MSAAELIRVLRRTKEVYKLGSLYKHIRSGALYRITGHAYLESGLQMMILYEGANLVPFARPQIDFEARFKKVEISER
ncbi:MAG: hypothetical protein ACRCYS_17505 [Beijerinckiaceae bacterium]